MTYDPERNKGLTKRGAGRLAVLPKISPYEAKQEALLMIRRGRMKPQTKLYHAIGLLGTAGVLLEEHLLEFGNITARTLRRYRKNGILDIVPTPKTLQEELGAGRVWTLGAIGLQLAKLSFELVPTGYLESKIDNITHDVLCNLVYYHIYQAARQVGYTAILKSRYEATLKDFRNNAVLQPDAMIILRHNTTKSLKHFVVEYHNENFSSRAAEKVSKYERVYKDVDWEDQWHVKRFPPILIVTTHSAVAYGYKKDIEERQVGVGVRCRYLIKPLRTFLEESQPPLIWLDLARSKSINILQ